MKNINHKNKIKIAIMIVAIFMLFGCINKKEEVEEVVDATTTVSIPSFNEIEVKAIWFSYVDYRDLMQGLNEEQFTEKVNEIIANCKSIGINTIYVHTVAHTDAYYQSQIYPMSKYLQGVDYDPFSIFVKAAHDNGMRIEAWINPMRSMSEEDMAQMSDEYLVKQWVNEGFEGVGLVNGNYYLNPGSNDVKELILSVVDELIANYDIDGIHMDDYFYPAEATEEFDSVTYSRLGGAFTLQQYRKNNVNAIVKEIHDRAQANNIVFGISPSGNIDYSVDTIFGDVYAWVEQGSVDYLIPQIYWGYEHRTRPFLDVLASWQDVVKDSNVKLIIGLAAYKIGVEESYNDPEGKQEWVLNNDIISRQIKDCEKLGTYGYALFSYHSLFSPSDDVKTAVKNELDKLFINN